MTTQKRIAVVTGNNRGLGYTISRQLSQIGNCVILTSCLATLHDRGAQGLFFAEMRKFGGPIQLQW